MDFTAVDIFVPVIVALITALTTVHVGNKRTHADLLKEEMDEKVDFRKSLFIMIEKLQSDLGECNKKHKEAEKELSQLRARMFHLEQILSKHGIELVGSPQ